MTDGPESLPEDASQNDAQRLGELAVAHALMRTAKAKTRSASRPMFCTARSQPPSSSKACPSLGSRRRRCAAFSATPRPVRRRTKTCLQ
jgi:hypothetical protein